MSALSDPPVAADPPQNPYLDPNHVDVLIPGFTDEEIADFHRGCDHVAARVWADSRR